MRLTISDIARLANVSTSAVSIVLNNKKGVSDKTRSSILEIIKKYKYNPNQIAKSLAAKETKSIGLIIEEIDNPYFAKVMRGVYNASSQLGYSVLLGSSELSPDKEIENINTLVSKRVDGLIIFPLHTQNADFTYLSNLLSDKYPLVILGNVKNYITNVVDIDNTKAAKDAVTYLIKQGHTKIAHFSGSFHAGHGEERLDGYKQALIDNGIAVNKKLIVPVEPETLSGYKVGKDFFSKKGDYPTAVFCYNDLVAIGLMNTLAELGINIPNDVSVMGFDNIEFGRFMKTPLTTIEMPAYEIGKAAAKLLIKQIKSSKILLNERVILEHKIIERQSVKKISLKK
jgi:LacI family transcriptional regulator